MRSRVRQHSRAVAVPGQSVMAPLKGRADGGRRGPVWDAGGGWPAARPRGAARTGAGPSQDSARDLKRLVRPGDPSSFLACFDGSAAFELPPKRQRPGPAAARDACQNRCPHCHGCRSAGLAAAQGAPAGAAPAPGWSCPTWNDIFGGSEPATPVQGGAQAAVSSLDLTADTGGTIFAAPQPLHHSAWQAFGPHAATAPPAEAPATRADCLLEDLLSQELDTISSPGDAVGKLAGDVDDLENDRFFQMLLEAP